MNVQAEPAVAGPTRRAVLSVPTAFCAALFFLFALAAAPASASVAHQFKESFGPDGTAATSFEHPAALAVDSSSHDLYVADLAAGTVEKFDENHEPAEFTAGPGAGSDRIAGFTFHPEEAGVSQLAADPQSHEFYVVNDSPANSIAAFHADGEPAEFTKGPGEGSNEIGGFGELCGLAVDSNGDVYAGDYDSGVHVYAPSGEELTNFSTPTPCNLAVDSQGAVYVNHWQGPTEKFTPSAYPLAPSTTYESAGTVDQNSAFGVAVDPASGDLYVDERTAVAQYDQSGEPIGTFASATPGALSASEGLAVDGASGDVYLSDAGGERQVELFTPPPPLPPTIDATSVGAVSSAAADLSAQINPHYFTTHYHFEYIDEVSYEANLGAGHDPFAGAAKAPAKANATLAASGADLTATQHVQGLAPSTTYRIRVLADNGNGGPQTGATATFTTQQSNPSLGLPDDRGYEMVSPLAKGGGEILPSGGISSGGVDQASANGNRVTYISLGVFGDPQAAPPGSQYLGTRGPGGWSAQSIDPPQDSGAFFPANGIPYQAFSADLSRGLVSNGQHPPIQAAPPPGTGAPIGYQNDYIRDNGDGSFRALLTATDATPNLSAEQFGLGFEAATPDLGHVVVSVDDALTPGATLPQPGTHGNLYEWSPANGGEFQPVNVLPGVSDGATALPAELPQPDRGSGNNFARAISNDGSRVFWNHGEGLYLRENIGRPQSPLDAEGNCEVPTDACTVQVDATQHGADASGEGEFLTATPDGSQVFFRDNRRLTPDSTARPGSGDRDLYEFDTNTGRLADLSVDRHADPEGASVQGVLGTGDDGSRVYFVAQGVLTEEPNPRGETAQVEQPNLYLYDAQEGKTTFLATLTGGDVADWAPANRAQVARVTPDGRVAAFLSTASLTGPESAGPARKVYLYDVAASGVGALICVSCNPTGAPPLADSSLPAGAPYGATQAIYLPRSLSAAGTRLFFDSGDALVPRDGNNHQDVYEWEAQGTGTCTDHPGCVFLISSGTSTQDSTFVDAGENGDDVFFLTAAQLVRGDVDHAVDLYDARVGGGFPESPPPAPCLGDACQAPATAPNDPSPASSAFSGPGNPLECPKGNVKQKGKCVKRKAKHSKKHKHKKRHARTNRRAGQ